MSSAVSKCHEIASTLRAARMRVEPTAKIFYTTYAREIGTSYSNFVSYENGSRLPPVEYLQRVYGILNLNFEILCHLWARAQMPDQETKNFFKAGSLESSTNQRPSNIESIEKTHVFSRSDIPILKKHKLLWPCAVFLVSFSRSKPVSVSEVMKFLGAPKAKTEQLLNRLEQMGIAIKTPKGQFTTPRKRLFIPPDDEAFTEVRNSNFRVLTELVLNRYTTKDRALGRANRFTFTAPISEANIESLGRKLIELESFMNTLDQNGSSLYSLCLAFSKIHEIGE